jgi:hypothetical protein
MISERRNFLQTGTAGLALGLVNPFSALAQTSAAASSGQLEGGTGSVSLKGQLKSGVLALEAKDFVEGRDRALVVRGEFNSIKVNSIKLYCAMFSYDHDRMVFALFRDHDHSTSLVLSDSEDPKVGRLLIWNDVEAPGTFRVDKEKVFEVENLKESILDGKGSSLELVGKRQAPVFSLEEIESVFGKNPVLREFMRGERSIHHPRPEQKLIEWICHFLSKVPGNLFAAFWAAKP